MYNEILANVLKCSDLSDYLAFQRSTVKLHGVYALYGQKFGSQKNTGFFIINLSYFVIINKEIRLNDANHQKIEEIS